MNTRILIFLLACFVEVSNASTGSKVQSTGKASSDEYREKYILRAKELYSCSNYFYIVGTQRKKQDEIDRYNEFSLKAKGLGDGLIAKLNSEKAASKANEYYKDGTRQAIQMIKDIGKDKTGGKFKETTIWCYKTVRREELSSDIVELNENLEK